MTSFVHRGIRILGVALAACSLPWSTAPAQTDSAAVVRVVDAFHTALVSKDSAAAMALLAPDAVVLEGGYLETRPEYAAGHLGADMAFLAGMTRHVSGRTVTITDHVAWVGTTSHLAGEYYGRKIESDGAELMVLRRHETGWLIEAIHWSSGR